MEIKAKGVFDYESIKSLTHVSMFGRKKPKNSFMRNNIMFACLLMLLMIEMIIFGVDVQLIVLLILDALLFAFNCFIYFIMPKIQFNALQQMKNIENHYIFSDDIITVTSKNENYTGETQLNYSIICKVIENSKYVYIFHNKNQVFMVDKSSIVNGTMEDIKAKILPFVKNKYIICKY